MMTLTSISGTSGTTARRVLLAEDNPVNQKVALALLGALAIKADVARDGVEAVRAIFRGDYAAVLMDCQMPVMDGYTATQEIRKREQKPRRIPIIAMTAAAMEGERERCIAAGMDDYISKPVNLEELDAVLRRWIDAPTSPLSNSSVPIEGSAATDTSIDPARIEELRALKAEGKPDTFMKLARIFLVDGQVRLKGIRDAIRRDDPSAIAWEAHALRGSAANLGAHPLAERCRELEELAGSGSLDGIEDLMTQLESEFERVQEVLRQHQ